MPHGISSDGSEQKAVLTSGCSDAKPDLLTTVMPPGMLLRDLVHGVGQLSAVHAVRPDAR
jgi:hypothetical protein